MAETGTRHDPLLAYRFEVRLDDLPAAGFSECGGLELSTDFLDHPEGGMNTQLHKLPGRTRQTNLRLKRGIVDRALYDWYADLARGLVRRRGGSVVIRDPSGEREAAVWQFRRALPAKWVGPELNATQSQVAVETLELVHEGLERVR